MEQHLGTINFQALEECENNICQALLDWLGCCLCNEKRIKKDDNEKNIDKEGKGKKRKKL